MAPPPNPYDLAIIGGGINGAGIACDAAGRGLSVLLVEAGDLAGATSSASSKLIHGGLRYLEYREFRLVREALAEHEVLLAKAPHIVWPLRFVLPHVAAQRPRWMIRLGLFLYDHLAHRTAIPGSHAIDLHSAPAGRPLRPDFRHGFTYWDCWVDDARLVVLNARAAANRGADIRTRTRFLAARREDEAWHFDIRDEATGRTDTVTARAVVNAAGPWADSVLAAMGDNTLSGAARIRRVKGSHLVVPRIEGADDAYILQQPDGRVVFVLPYEDDFSLIGTTDVAYDGDSKDVQPGDDEIVYLLAAVNRFFTAGLRESDIVWRFAGVRPLFDDAAAAASAVPRDYHLVLSEPEQGAPLLSIFGGKITTYRCLAEEALARLAPVFPAMRPASTAKEKLPGGDISGGRFDEFLKQLCARYPDFDRRTMEAMAHRHGSLIERVLGTARKPEDLGRPLGAGLYEREVEYMRDKEWARTPDDILWRRTKAGLHLTPTERDEAARTIEALL